MFKKTLLLTRKDKRDISEMHRHILFWMLEGRNTEYMAKYLNLSPEQVDYNIDETLYLYRKHVGRRRYLKLLFTK